MVQDKEKTKLFEAAISAWLAGDLVAMTDELMALVALKGIDFVVDGLLAALYARDPDGYIKQYADMMMAYKAVTAGGAVK